MARQDGVTSPGHGVINARIAIGRGRDELGTGRAEGHVEDLIIVSS